MVRWRGVCSGHTADPQTWSTPGAQLQKTFGLKHVCLVGDRGLLTSARIREDVQPLGLDWVIAVTGIPMSG